MLTVHFEESCHSALRSIFTGSPNHFQITDEPSRADIIIFQRDEWRFLRRSALLQKYAAKCISITEWDKPSFFLPGAYASNEACWLSRRRAETINYLITARIGGNEWVTRLAQEPVEKKYLYSFTGKSSSRVRKHILRRYGTQRVRNPPVDVLIESSDHAVHDLVMYSDDARRHHAEVMRASKYALCPRGWGVSSVRLFEACEMGIAPVILSDRWVPIGSVDWSFAIFVKEGRVADLDRIVRDHDSEWQSRGQRARQAFVQHFAPAAAAQELAAAILRLTARIDPGREAMLRRLYPLFHFGNLARERLRKWFVSYRP